MTKHSRGREKDIMTMETKYREGYEAWQEAFGEICFKTQGHPAASHSIRDGRHIITGEDCPCELCELRRKWSVNVHLAKIMMLYTKGIDKRETIIAYQVFPWTGEAWGTVVYTAVPRTGEGIVAESDETFHVPAKLMFPIAGRPEYFLVVRWDMDGPTDYKLQHDDNSDPQFRGGYDPKTQGQWIMDRAICNGTVDWQDLAKDSHD